MPPQGATSVPGWSLAQGPGTWDVGDMGLKATISASFGLRLALFVAGERPPRLEVCACAVHQCFLNTL